MPLARAVLAPVPSSPRAPEPPGARSRVLGSPPVGLFEGQECTSAGATAARSPPRTPRLVRTSPLREDSVRRDGQILVSEELLEYFGRACSRFSPL